MTRLVYGNIELQVLDGYSMTKSSQDVTFNSISCDFTGYTQEDLPDKYQEVKLVEDGNVLFFGYVDEYSFKEMREVDIETEIEITLLSPMKLATLRTVMLSGTYRLLDLIPEVLKPLIDDGFSIEELEITNRTITTNYPLNTVEYCMNNLSNKFNFWWFIDEHKKIYIKDISLMLSKKPNYKYDSENKIPYLQYIKPTVSSEGYANVVNFNNVRIYESTYYDDSLEQNINPMMNKFNVTIKDGEQIDFAYPIDFTEKNIKKSLESQGLGTSGFVLYVVGTYSDGSSFIIDITYDTNNGLVFRTPNVGFDGDGDNKEFSLIRDSFFSNLITGFKFSNSSKNIISISTFRSHSILVYNIMRLYNDGDIANKRGKISETGIVETTIDMNESWKTLQELQEIGVSYMNKNSLKLDGELELKIDTTCNMQVGNTIKIDKLLFTGIYIITKIQLRFVNNYKEWVITCKNGNMLNNFIDIFRGENTQENEEKTYKTSIVHYVEEKINEVFEVVK